LIWTLPGVARRLVDPLQKTLEVYRLEKGRWVVASTHGGDERVCVEPFTAVELQLARMRRRCQNPNGEAGKVARTMRICDRQPNGVRVSRGWRAERLGAAARRAC
jgi:hypothetical protein